MSNKKMWLIALAACLLLATVAPLASSAPDGLERIAEEKGFAEMARSSPFGVAAGYLFPGIENKALAAILAGWLGTIIVFLIVYGCARLIYRIKRTPLRP